MSELVNGLDAALSQSVTHLTDLLQESAQKSGWSKDLSQSINIGYAGNVLQTNVPKDREEEVFQKEYGTETSAPTAVLRKFSSHPKAANIMDKHMHTHVNSVLEQFVEELF